MQVLNRNTFKINKQHEYLKIMRVRAKSLPLYFFQQEQKRIEKFKNLEVYKDLKYPTDDGIGQGYIADNYDSNSSSFASRPLADNKGLRFGNIKTIKEDDAKQAERIENRRIQFIKGV